MTLTPTITFENEIQLQLDKGLDPSIHCKQFLNEVTSKNLIINALFLSSVNSGKLTNIIYKKLLENKYTGIQIKIIYYFTKR